MAERPASDFPPQLKRWIQEEVDEQMVRYRKIVEEMDALAPQRERWIQEFLERIQTRGYHVHADILRKIRPEELPQRPDRELRVVF